MNIYKNILVDSLSSNVRNVLLALLFSMGSYSTFGVTWPDTPLGVSSSATPMTMIVSGKDHKLFYEAYNDASDIDADGSIDVRFKPTITYYGLFDSKLCYEYNANAKLFTPVAQSNGQLGHCNGHWSGNWMNYITTSRIDALRKVLYGGYREIDTPDQTVLRRAYIPQDAHSWAKEYTSPVVDGYDIQHYTPLNLPTNGRRHFFGNLTSNANTDCANLNTCSNLPPLMSVVIDSHKRVWQWASKERPVLDGSHGGSLRTDYSVRVSVCTAQFRGGCRQYPNGHYKPVGLLHQYGEDGSMLFGLLTGSYNKNLSGGVLRKVVADFGEEINQHTGQFGANATIVQNFNNLRIRDYNNGLTNSSYRGGRLTKRSMTEGEFIDWGNPVGEMMYEALRYFAGKGAPTPAYNTAGGFDAHVGLSAANWDNPYSQNSAAQAYACSKPNMLVVSDINPSFDSDQLPGSHFGGLTGDLSGLNVTHLADRITDGEPSIRGQRIIGQSGTNYDGAPTPKRVESLANIRGLAPEEPTKQGSYYSSAIAHYGKTHDINLSETGKQTVDSFYVALTSPLPKIEFSVEGRTITIVPFAKSVGNNRGPWTDFHPTNQIVDFYVEYFSNMPGAPVDSNVNGGRPYIKFQINFEDVEQGADHDMDAIVEYEILATAAGRIEVNLRSAYAAGGIIHHIGYVISGTTQDGTYLVVRDLGHADDVDPDYALDVPNVPGPLPHRSNRVFTPGLSTATLLKNPLWYAAKWGGFTDTNGNNLPDLDHEWDSDGNGEPDNYFLVQSPLKLKESLRDTLDNIIARSGSSGSISANSTSISETSVLFQASYNTTKWSGDLLAYPIDHEGINSVPNWFASEQLPPPNARRIYTVSDSGDATAFQWLSLSSTDKTALGSQSVLNYLRGQRGSELQNGGTLRDRPRNNVLGDIIHSTTTYDKETNTVYVGANSGMLHAFNAETGVERFAFIPRTTLQRIKALSEPGYQHSYFVDGQIVLSNTQPDGARYLVSTLGLGDKGLFALNVVDPEGFRTRHFEWDYFDASDDDLGFMLGAPVIAKLNNGKEAVIVGNGYNSVSGKAVLYIFELATGNLLAKLDTEAGGDNGLTTPGLFDSDNDGDIDAIYAGDLKGNLWKFDVSRSSPTQWRPALGGQPLFVATNDDGIRQPITSQIEIAVNDDYNDPNFGKRFILFGTGSYFRINDSGNSDIQSWYGIIDADSEVRNRNYLKERGIEAEGMFDGHFVRSFENSAPDDMDRKKGWYIDFDTQVGERIVTGSKYYNLAVPVLVTSSIIPIEDPCLPGGRGYINAINPFTGARIDSGLFDVNNNRNFNDDVLANLPIGGIDLGIGMPGQPILVGDQLAAGGSNGNSDAIRVNLGTANVKGRVMWREIIVE